jgi:hypothetical protein
VANLSQFPSGYRAYSQPFGTSNGNISFNQLYDQNWIWNNGASLVTGAWRPFFPSDFAATISGLSVSVGAVAITGVNNVAVTGTTNVNITNPVLAVSGAFSTTIGNVAVTGGNITVSDTTLETGLAYLNTLTLQNQSLLQAISGGTANQNTWTSVSSSGFVQSFSPVSGKASLNRINGYSKTPSGFSFIQVFDGPAQAGFPIATLAVQSGNNFYYEFSSDQGITITGGITVANSTDAVLTQPGGSSDFFVSVVYKQLS